MTRLPGDIDGDGDVDFADVTAANASGDFSKVTEALANFGAMEYRVTVEPLFSEKSVAVLSSLGLRYMDAEQAKSAYTKSGGGANWTADDVPVAANFHCFGVESFHIGSPSLGMTPKIDEPRNGYPKETRRLRVSRCEIVGDGGSVPVVEVGQWGGGVYFVLCRFSNVKTCVPNAAAHICSIAADLKSDFAHNVRAVVGCCVKGIRKPEGTDYHPDLWQQSWKAGSKTGPLLIDGLRGRDIHAQCFFINSPYVVLPAVYVKDFDVEATPDNGYVSQIRSPVGLLVFDGFRLINQDLSILRKPDGAGGFLKTIGTCVIRREFKVVTKQGVDASEAVVAALKSISTRFIDERPSP